MELVPSAVLTAILESVSQSKTRQGPVFKGLLCGAIMTSGAPSQSPEPRTVQGLDGPVSQRRRLWWVGEKADSCVCLVSGH
jgi:hypothetical protein